MKSAAERTLERTQRALAQDPAIGAALGYGAVALAALGEAERSKEWTKRALLMDPDNRHDALEPGLRIVGPPWRQGWRDRACSAAFVDRLPPTMVGYLRLDTDFDPLRDDPRFEALAVAAEARLVSESSAAAE